ncbi:TetR family transcriptional regulator [Kitasatospora phosalacinea]|uniref:TetR family transcriptional regulator n=1 Tax=Kitasatospora phosalacinea TaxID=2065 RepID=A0A9W6QFZ9_9ACTN|nr:TetR family transcriptional regulator [Kitasatospora phosalacinea]
MKGMTPPRQRPADRPARERRRASHSIEAVLGAAVELLDESGEPALTIRGLASRLGTGVGSVYWYVSGRDDLLDRAVDHVLGGVLAEIERHPRTGDPVDELRRMAVTLFDAVVDRPWLGSRFMRGIDAEGNSLRLYEELGRQLLRLDLTPLQRFHAVTAVLGVVVSAAADLGQEPPQAVVDGLVEREEFLGRFAATWRALDPGEYPFLHDIVDAFDGHDDKQQFLAALDLTLTGLRQLAGQGPEAP